ncbi:MAG: hypothetical protein WC789_12030 [Lentisphaeria bacterium]|jgi:BASS family bile acid:Na+ symporter
MKAFRKTALLLASLLTGALAHRWLHGLAAGIQGLLVAMLFLTFLRLTLRRSMFRRRHLTLLLAQGLLAVAVYGLLRNLNGTLALAGLMIALMPTATAAPVVTGLLGGNVGFVTAYLFLTSLGLACLLPLLLPLLAPAADGGFLGASGHLLLNIGLVVFLPLAAAQFLRRWRPRLAVRARRWQPLSFHLWCLALVLISARATQFVITHPELPRLLLAESAGLALAICLANFAIGHRVGGRPFGLEAGQALGQKNTVLVIWVCLTFLSPAVALGPTFYVIWHNLVNGWQLWRHEQARARRAPLPAGGGHRGHRGRPQP